MIIHQPSNSRGNYNYNATIYKNAHWTLHFHANFELIYVYEGSADVSLNGATDTLEKGEMMLIPPYTVHSLFVTAGKTWVGVFSEDFITSFAKQYKYVRFSKFTCSPEIEALLQKHLFTEDRPDRFLHISCLYMVCNECVKNALVLATEQNYKFIHGVIGYITEHTHQDIALKDIAKAMNYEYHYFSSLFHQSFGMNFKSFVNLLRFEQACSLLTDEVSVTQVAERCGFGSIRNFNRVFKSLSGVTPLEYKKQRSGEERL